jgi:hypothetical protein
MPAPDPSADWWTMDDVAAYLGLKVESVRRYRSRALANGGLPKEDRKFGQSPAWKPETIVRWHEGGRPGAGKRTDLAADE